MSEKFFCSYPWAHLDIETINKLPVSHHAVSNFVNLISALENWQYNHENNYKDIHNILDRIQAHHPDRNIKQIFNIYYENSYA